MDYKESGVDVEAGYKAVELMKKHVKSTHRPEVITDLGGFGGLFSLAGKTMQEPVLVSGTDGVGTKLKVAFAMDKRDTVGIDCVAMCVNDVICAGAEPLFFLDYIACGKNEPEKIADIVKGVSEGCRQSGAALIGGETAEMPGFYPQEEFDLAGFCVGIVDKKNIIDGSTLVSGDILIGLPSSGVHSNGFSLVRRLWPMTPESLDEKLVEGEDKTLGQVLLEPTRIYVKALKTLIEAVHVKAVSHITGGGFIENLPRMLNENTHAKITMGSWPILPIFRAIQQKADMSDEKMYNTYNMGIGMVVAVDVNEKDQALKALEEIGEKAYVIGTIESGERGLTLC